ncbi:unnamed protein product [Caenorhabditis auriculariae]|uniref:Uncharacterized protein n=1 Tax=Caenorhabditis auriculariae TaxID=2777116 RepID=A0A8S1H4W3_9PELO|nr:unnamed protein product [Caenorhabditis auriculariae]
MCDGDVTLGECSQDNFQESQRYPNSISSFSYVDKVFALRATEKAKQEEKKSEENLLGLVAAISGPLTAKRRQSKVVDITELDMFAHECYNCYMDGLFSSSEIPGEFCGEEDFKAVIRELLRIRVENVLGMVNNNLHVSGSKLQNSIKMPKILEKIISAYGVVNVWNGSTILYPTLNNNQVQCKDEQKEKFNKMMKALEEKKVVKMSVMSLEPTGTAAWCLLNCEHDPGRRIASNAPARPTAATDDFALIGHARCVKITDEVYEWPWVCGPFIDLISLRRKAAFI